MSDAPGYNRICRIRMRLPRESRITIAHPRRIRGATPRNKTDRNTSRDCGIHRQTPLILENERSSSQVNAKRPLNEFENQEPFVGHLPRYRLARFSSTRSISHRAALQVAVPGRDPMPVPIRAGGPFAGSPPAASDQNETFASPLKIRPAI